MEEISKLPLQTRSSFVHFNAEIFKSPSLPFFTFLSSAVHAEHFCLQLIPRYAYKEKANLGRYQAPSG